MSAAALAGFSGAWALFRHVLPEAGLARPGRRGCGGPPGQGAGRRPAHGSGLEFAPPGSADAGANLRAASVIWEWTEVNRREVTWLPQFATALIATIRPTQ